jgi:hypothetical protein
MIKTKFEFKSKTVLAAIQREETVVFKAGIAARIHPPKINSRPQLTKQANKYLESQ